MTAFRATGQEGGTASPLGIAGLSLPSTAPIVGIGNIDSMPSLLSAYRLPANSSFVGKGLNLQTQFGINPGPRDFWGNASKNNAIGA